VPRHERAIEGLLLSHRGVRLGAGVVGPGIKQAGTPQRRELLGDRAVEVWASPCWKSQRRQPRTSRAVAYAEGQGCVRRVQKLRQPLCAPVWRAPSMGPPLEGTDHVAAGQGSLFRPDAGAKRWRCRWRRASAACVHVVGGWQCVEAGQQLRCPVRDQGEIAVVSCVEKPKRSAGPGGCDIGE